MGVMTKGSSMQSRRCIAIGVLLLGFVNQVLGLYHVREFTEDRDKRWCAYNGYMPEYEPALAETEHTTAWAQTEVLNSVYTASSWSIATGTLESVNEGIFDAFSEYADDWYKTNKQMLQKASKFAMGFMKSASFLSPAVGVIAAIMGGVAGAESPTAEDILKEANKAIDKLAREVDRKLNRMRNYVDEKVVEVEKSIGENKYSFLFKYWMGCIEAENEEEVNACNQDAHLLIRASEDEFLLHHSLMDMEKEGSRKIPDDKLTMDDRKRIEVNMMLFRNYALLSLTCMKTLADTYKDLRKKDNIGEKSCEETRRIELANKDKEVDDRPINHQKWCNYEEELLKKSMYYETYGFAAIEEIKAVAAHRLVEVDPIFDEPFVKWHNEYTYTYHPNGGGKMQRGFSTTFSEKRLKCSAYVHPSVKDPSKKCTFEVQLIEDPSAENKQKTWYGSTNDWKKSYKWQYADSYNKIMGISDQKSGDGSPAIRWCKSKIRKARKNYNTLEQADIERYWHREVMQTIICGRMLSDGSVKVCVPVKLEKVFPEALEGLIKLKDGSAKVSAGTDEADKAVDGFLETHTATSGSWEIQIDSSEDASKMIITRVMVYFPKSAFPPSGVISKLTVNTKTAASSSYRQCSSKAVSKTSTKEIRVEGYDLSHRGRLPPPVYLHEVVCETKTPVEFVQISQASGTLQLAEVKLLGYFDTTEQPKKELETFTATLNNAQQTKAKPPHTADSAIDGWVKTYSETEAGRSGVISWQADLKEPAYVQKAELILEGRYTSVKVEVEMQNGQKQVCESSRDIASMIRRGSYWVTCDTTKQELIKTIHVTNDSPQEESSEGEEPTNVLKIREIKVYASKKKTTTNSDNPRMTPEG